MASKTTVLITGANRGIGKGLLETYLARDHTTVIATVRSVAAASTALLDKLHKGTGSDLIVLEMDVRDERTAIVAVNELSNKHGVTHLDTVIANAGIANDFSQVAKLPMHVLKDHMEVNGYAPLLLFQAVLPLLEKSKSPKFVAIGSPIGSIGGMETRPFPMPAYGASKAVLHYFMRKIHLEHPNITTFPVDPGFVQTDMGNSGARFFGMKEATTTIPDAVKFVVTTIDQATREKTSGHFPSIESGDFAW